MTGVLLSLGPQSGGGRGGSYVLKLSVTRGRLELQFIKILLQLGFEDKSLGNIKLNQKFLKNVGSLEYTEEKCWVLGGGA